MNTKEGDKERKARKQELIQSKRSFKSLRLSFSTNPLVVIRGSGCYLYDEEDTPYLDTRNNVAILGHQHPEWIKAVTKQLHLTNTNSRYLHPIRNKLESTLLSLIPLDMA